MTANTTLTASQAGHWFESQASNLTITLPPLASLPSGMATYTFRAPLALTLKANGSELIQSASGVAANTLSVASGECVTLVSDGAGGSWYVVLDGFGSASFSKSFGTNGYQKLPSGLIIQWGVVGCPANYSANTRFAFNFPIAFPSSALHIILSNSGISNLTPGTQAEVISRSHAGVCWSISAVNAFGLAASYVAFGF